MQESSLNERHAVISALLLPPKWKEAIGISTLNQSFLQATPHY